MEKQKDQLCWSCKNACGGCEWSANLEPVPGWTAEKVPRDTGTRENKRKGFSYKITECPKFERG